MATALNSLWPSVAFRDKVWTTAEGVLVGSFVRSFIRLIGKGPAKETSTPHGHRFAQQMSNLPLL